MTNISVLQRIEHKKATSQKNGWWSFCLLMMNHRKLLDFVSDFFAFQ